MKKFTLLMASAALALSASAQELVAEPVTIANPSFEEAGEGLEEGKEHFVGWDLIGASKDMWAQRAHTNSANDGDWYIRIAGNDGLEPGTMVRQFVDTNKPAGVYVLKAAVSASRNGWRGDINAVGGGEPYVDENNMGSPLNMYCALYIADEDDNPEDPEGRGFLKVGEDMGKWQELAIVYKVEYDNPNIEIGYGLPTKSQGIPKPNIQCDNFSLDYYPTDDVDAVKAQIATSGVDVIMVAPSVKDNKFYNLKGQEVKDASKPGLYIHNGQKILK